jgi:hypothetical protein
VAAVTCRDGAAGGLVIEATPVPGADISLELHAANSRVDLLTEAVGGPVVVEQVDAGDSAPRPAA